MLAGLPGLRPPLRHPVRRHRGSARPAVRRPAHAAGGLGTPGSGRRGWIFRRWCRSTAGRLEACATTLRGRHRRADAEAQGQPLSRRPAERPLVQMEARRASARRRADVRPARPWQAFELLFGLHLWRLARGHGRAWSWCRSARPISASPMRNCLPRPMGARQHHATLRPGARGTPALVLEVAFDRRIARRGTNRAWRCAFPRIHRIRWDKPAAEADRLERLERLIG